MRSWLNHTETTRGKLLAASKTGTHRMVERNPHGRPISAFFPEPTTALRPGLWPLRSTGGRADTSTLTWIARRLPAEGREYRLRLEFRTDAAPIPGVTAYSKKAALVAEVWSAGGS
jgi:hypothetical protein